MRVREVPVEEAIGLTLAYDLTRISPDKKKGAVLRRGHVLSEADVDILRGIGKSRIKILELRADEVHEDDAAQELAGLVAGEGIEVTMPGEAWADLVASRTGLLKVDDRRLLRLNLLDDVLAVTRHDNSPVNQGDLVGRVKVRGLSVRRAVLDRAGRIVGSGPEVLQLLPYGCLRVGAVITGRDVAEGRKKDEFAPLLRQRVEHYGSNFAHVEVVADELPEVSRAIRRALDLGLDLILVAGGGSPDDCTSASIRATSDEVAFHGVPVAPGAMTILAYAKGVPILGVPGGLLARPRGFLDLILPRLLAGDRPTKRDAAAYGHGGLCLRCEQCHFPACSFGK